MFKMLLSLFVGLLIVGCSTIRSSKNEPSNSDYFSFLSATLEKYSSPRPGGAKREEFNFTIITKTENKLFFDSAWAMNNGYSLFLIKKNAPVSIMPFPYGKGDTLVVRISTEQKLIKEIASPFSYTGDALLRYEVNGKKHYFIVPKISKLNFPPSQ